MAKAVGLQSSCINDDNYINLSSKFSSQNWTGKGRVLGWKGKALWKLLRAFLCRVCWGMKAVQEADGPVSLLCHLLEMAQQCRVLPACQLGHSIFREYGLNTCCV